MSIISKMLRFAGRGDDGTAKAVRTNNDGHLKTQISDSDIMLPVDVQSHNIGEINKIPVGDLSVKAELELVKAELTAIKNGTLSVSDAKLVDLETKLDTLIAKQDQIYKTELTGSYSILSTEAKPVGNENDSLLEYNVTTGETKIFKFISGEWREL